LLCRRLDRATSKPYDLAMYTIIETPLFTDDARTIWSEEERGAFCTWLAAHPLAGDVVPSGGGCRKVRWTRAGTGKRGGVRVIDYNQLENGTI